ncbi:hypothetical protein K5D42_25130 [Pseudomonas cichorii]|nr:hypothetical protein [Pseudomonas cichorii]MBX8493157.1 hypothetical protein [Pseudomonas cichorii]
MENSGIKPPTASNVYVGIDHYERIYQSAIDVSNDIRIQVTTSQFAQHLVDHYSDIARQNWKQEWKQELYVKQHRVQARENPEIKPPSAHNVYVGHERYERIYQSALDVSSDIRIQITPSNFVRHLVDHYSKIARQNWMSVLVKSAQNSVVCEASKPQS